ncbi:MAG: SMC family ATPase [Firmicutes bacterium]|nr:SMC family ATPase [Bacillota bacterium]
MADSYKQFFAKKKSCQKDLESLNEKDKILDKKLNFVKDAIAKIDGQISALAKFENSKILNAKNEVFQRADGHFKEGLKSAKFVFKDVELHFKALKGYLDDGLLNSSKDTAWLPGDYEELDFKQLLENKRKLQQSADELLLLQKISAEQKTNFTAEIAKSEAELLSIETEGKSLREQKIEIEECFKKFEIGLNCDILKLIEDKNRQVQNLKSALYSIEKENEKLKEVSVNIKNLCIELWKLNLENIDNDNILTRFKKLEEDIETAQKQKGELDGLLKSFIVKETELSNLNNDYSVILKKYETADKLRKGIKNKALMDFAVKEYFIDICDAASEKLSYLSDGKFELIFDNGFFVKDNLNGGRKRDVCTLSGGETFLVSLSLAISLSEAIVCMSNRPIEFFFLDEGFGTLDENLVDTVLTALFKLTKTHFCIGLISHVPELKTRITNKLLLEKTNGVTKILTNFAC